MGVGEEVWVVGMGRGGCDSVTGGVTVVVGCDRGLGAGKHIGL